MKTINKRGWLGTDSTGAVDDADREPHTFNQVAINHAVELDRLKTQNAELLAVLERFMKFVDYNLIEISATERDGRALGQEWIPQVRAILAKAKK